MIAPSGLISRLAAIAAAIDRRLASLGGESIAMASSRSSPCVMASGKSGRVTV